MGGQNCSRGEGLAQVTEPTLLTLRYSVYMCVCVCVRGKEKEMENQNNGKKWNGMELNDGVLLVV